MKRKKVKIPLYYGKFEITITKDLYKANKKFKINIDEEKSFFDKAAITFRSKDKRDVGILLQKANVNQSDVIAHEAVHLASYVFKGRSIEHDMYNEESYAYLVGWFTKQISEFVREL